MENKVVPDPFYGLENKEIVDIADSGREHYTFWFFTKFECKLVRTDYLMVSKLQRISLFLIFIGCNK